jgi:hypothetical protein
MNQPKVTTNSCSIKQEKSRVADPGCLSRIQGQKDFGSGSKNFGIFNPKNYFQALGRSGMFIPDPDLDFCTWIQRQKALDPGSATLEKSKKTVYSPEELSLQAIIHGSAYIVVDRLVPSSLRIKTCFL